MSFYIDPTDFNYSFRPVVLDRARDYFRSGAVRNVAQSDNDTWIAEVEGSETYLVTVKRVEDDLCECRCTCPYALEDACKHIAAVLMEIDSAENEILVIDESTDPKPSSKSSASDPFEDYMNRANKEQLAAFIRKISDFEPHIKKQFLSFMAPSDSGTGKSQYRKLVKSTLAPARHKGIMNSSEARRHLGPVYELLEKAHERKNSGPVHTVLNICQVVVEEMVPALQFIDDSNADVGDAIRWAIGLLHETAEQSLDRKERQAFFKWCIRSAGDERYEGWDFPDDFIDIAVNLAASDDQVKNAEAFLDERIKQFRGSGNDWSSTYNLESAVLQKTHLLKKTGRLAEADEWMAAHKNLTRVRSEMIQTAWERGETDAVKSLAKDAIQTLGKNAPGLIPGWQQWLLKAAETEGNADEVNRRLEELMASAPTMETYSKLKDNIPADEWPSYVREKLLPSLTSNYRGRWIMPDIYVREKWWDELLKYLKKHPDFQLLKRYEQFLLKTDLDEIFKLYEKLIREELQRYTGRKYYRRMCDVLKHVYQLGAERQVQQLLTDLCETYSNRPALLEEFDKLANRLPV